MSAQATVQLPEVYQGQFGEFVITPSDRWGVKLYRLSLFSMAICVALAAVGLSLLDPADFQVQQGLSLLFGIFCLGLGVSLGLIHIYLEVLHRALQICWGIGCAASVWWLLTVHQPLALTVYQNPWALLTVGWVFVALNGIYFKEAFCFNRLETKAMVVLLPMMMLGHLFHMLSGQTQLYFWSVWAVLFVIFGIRKVIQPIPQDIGDKSVFEYLHQQKTAQG